MMMHALWVVCQHVGLTLLYESRCWMEIELGNLLLRRELRVFGIDNITRSTLRSKAAANTK